MANPILSGLKQTQTVLGLMSGTSFDGLDMALIRIEGSAANTRISFLKGSSFMYSAKQKSALLRLINLEHNNALVLSQLNFYLAEIWAEMIKRFLRDHSLRPKDIDFIGSHGQTVWHQPQAEKFIDRLIRSTLQLGDPSVLAQLTGIPVIGDFRVADVALGGQGAPLIPYFDWVFFSQFEENILAVNIGGISNFTFVPANGDFNRVQAFDCGPGNMLIDAICQWRFNQDFDRDGKLARGGRFSESLFDFLVQADSFLLLPPPKSTGREHYGKTFLERVMEKGRTLNLKDEDILHTLTRYTAYTIFENARRYLEGFSVLGTVVVGGGGSRNGFIMKLLQEYFELLPVKVTTEYGLDDTFKEAIGFAVLANETWHGQPSNVPRVTGAKHPAILGKICLP